MMELTPLFMEQAECKGNTDLMYPVPGDEAGEAIAKSICEACPVVEPCRDYAIKHKEYMGVWAGLTEVERRSYARKLGRHATRKVQ